MKDSMVLQHFHLNIIPFFISNAFMFYNYCPTSPSRLMRKLWTSVKGNDWQIKMEYVLFWRYYHVLSKHWQPPCSNYSKCSNAASWLGKALFKRVNSFVEALINMVYELKVTSGFKKNCVKNFMVIRFSVEKLSAKNSVTRSWNTYLV